MPKHARGRHRRGRHRPPHPAAVAFLPSALLIVVGAVATTVALDSGGSAAPAATALAPTSAARALGTDLLQGPASSPAGPAAPVLLDVSDLREAPVTVAEAVPDRASRSRRTPAYTRPVDGPVTSPFGNRWGRLHAGIDFGVPVGTPVRVMMDGVVEASEYDAGGYGNVLKVRHADGTLSVYGHLSQVTVSSGPVLAGDMIALSGNTGHSTGPHLHFELRSSAGPFDPRPWLAERGLTL